MFKVNPDGMRMEPTPERVISVCRLIAHKSMTRDEVRKAMTLGSNDEKELDQINKSVNVALEELSIIKAQADNLVLAVDPDVIASPATFRRYVSSRVFAAKDTTFHMFTKWLIRRNKVYNTAFFLQMLHRFQNRLVLNRGRDEMIAPALKGIIKQA